MPSSVENCNSRGEEIFLFCSLLRPEQKPVRLVTPGLGQKLTPSRHIIVLWVSESFTALHTFYEGLGDAGLGYKMFYKPHCLEDGHFSLNIDISHLTAVHTYDCPQTYDHGLTTQ